MGCRSLGYKGDGFRQGRAKLVCSVKKQSGRPIGRPMKKKNGSKDPPLQDRLGIGAALQGWAVVIGAAGVGARWLLFGLLGFRAQGGRAGSVVRDLAREHDVTQTALHGIEFGGGDDVFLSHGEDPGDFLL